MICPRGDSQAYIHPLVSIIVITYNQADIIEEAVRSVFAQDYSPLEIILSDDCSTDHTFDILRRCKDHYDGPHEVILNRNPTNLGIGKHWDTISRQANGVLIVHAAGDDVSVPSRVSELVNTWMSLDPRPSLISSDGMITTYDGRPVRRHIGCRSPGTVQVQRKPRVCNLDFIDVPVCGFSMAIDRQLYDVFEPIQDYLWSEDQILQRRAILLQGIVYIPDTLVLYRDRGLSKGARKNQEAYLNLYLAQAETRLSTVRQSMRDVKTVSPSKTHAYIKTLQRQERSAKRRLRLFYSNLLISIMILVRQMLGSDREGIDRIEYLHIFMVKWMPQLFFRLRGMKVRLVGYADKS